MISWFMHYIFLIGAIRVIVTAQGVWDFIFGILLMALAAMFRHGIDQIPKEDR